MKTIVIDSEPFIVNDEVSILIDSLCREIDKLKDRSNNEQTNGDENETA